MIQLYDTTLRDGSQGEGVSFTVQDKLRITRRLDEVGIHYIEGGWPGSNPKDIAYFEAARDLLELRQAKVCAFGRHRRKRMRAAEDSLILQLADSGAPVVTIFGKSWMLHVTEVLGATADENLAMIADTIQFLKSRGLEAIYDAEHFFDGYKADPEYALATLRAAHEAGADALVLCDTNGGAMPWEIAQATRQVKEQFPNRIGIHTHNDCELGVANAIAGVGGATHVQGTMNGLGERTGNANLCSIIPILTLKMGLESISAEQLTRLSDVSAFVDELANMAPNECQPFVGRSAFAHKGGDAHADAVRKNPRTCEHMEPALVGNARRVLVSELSGGSTIVWKAEERGVELDKKAPETRRILEKIARLEAEGYVFEGAEASFDLLVKKETGAYEKLFDLVGFRVIVEKRGHDEEPITEATLKISVEGRQMLTVAEGDGPAALDGALRKALIHFYPELDCVRLTDFKVRVVDAKEGTGAKVRVLVEGADERGSWSTIGVSTNVIEASWQALADSVEYALLTRRE